ncbi:MAG: UDP-2,3-diacylglucosamine diphosphatase [Opitutales bacterium]
MKKATLKFKTIFLSDVHLGAPDCKIEEVNHFLKYTHSEKLVLNGDIIDGWSLHRRGGWTRDHTRFVRLLLKKLEKKNTRVIYTRGNHDDVLGRFLPMRFDNLEIVESHVHENRLGRYLVIHGDGFDAVTTNHKWLALAGDVGYQTLLRINRLYNKYRALRGKEYYSISKAIKARVKTAVSFIGKYEDQLQNLARKNKCRGIIAGHIHTPANKMVGDTHYLNSGDWVESMTALVEHYDDTFEILTYPEFLQRLDEKTARKAKKQKIICLEEELPPVEEEEDDDDDEDDDDIPAQALARRVTAFTSS